MLSPKHHRLRNKQGDTKRGRRQNQEHQKQYNPEETWLTAGPPHLINPTFPSFTPSASPSHNAINSVKSTATDDWGYCLRSEEPNFRRAITHFWRWSTLRNQKSYIVSLTHNPAAKSRVSITAESLPAPLVSVPSTPAQRVIYQRAIVRLDGHPLLLPPTLPTRRNLQLHSH